MEGILYLDFSKYKGDTLEPGPGIVSFLFLAFLLPPSVKN